MYIGDAIMAYWNAPGNVPDHADRAAIATLKQLHALDDLNAKLRLDPRFKDVVKMSDDNGKLRQKVDTIIVKYMKTIEELKKDNKKLNDKFDIAYEMHSIPKKKRLDKLLSK